MQDLDIFLVLENFLSARNSTDCHICVYKECTIENMKNSIQHLKQQNDFFKKLYKIIKTKAKRVAIAIKVLKILTNFKCILKIVFNSTTLSSVEISLEFKNIQTMAFCGVRNHIQNSKKQLLNII